MTALSSCAIVMIVGGNISSSSRTVTKGEMIHSERPVGGEDCNPRFQYALRDTSQRAGAGREEGGGYKSSSMGIC